MTPSKQRGSALIAALFLIVVLAALGVFAARIGADQQQTANLQLLQYRALAAANTGLEFWANRAFNNPAIPCAATNLNLNGFSGLNGFIVTVTCVRIVSAAQAVYEVTAVASSGAYGSLDFVRRTLTRRMTNISPPGTW